MTGSAIKVTRRDVWLQMLLYPRHTLPTAAAPMLVAVGLAMGDGVFAFWPALAAFFSGWLIQLGGVITDNYLNLKRHPHDREHALFVQAIQAGVITLSELKTAIYACYTFAMLVALYLVYVGGAPIVWIGLASIAASLAYSAGPFPLGDNALGDPLFFIFFGIVSVMATYYVQAAAVVAAPFLWTIPAGTITALSFWASLPMAALITNILIIDNIRDLAFDQEKGETTLAVVIGQSGSYVEYALLLALAYLTPLGLWLAGSAGGWALLPWLSLPYAIQVARRVCAAQDYGALMPLTPQAGQVALLFGLLFGMGLAL
ncbi:MAG: 1,4-dihydroxy-2-naphthoate octaprenyltransferase [Caldilineaceae bacterium]